LRECGQWAFFIRRQEQAGLQEDLEAIADAEDQPATVAKLAERVREEVLKLHRKNFSRSNVVAVTETAGQSEDLILAEELGILTQGVDVNAIDDGTGRLEREQRFEIAVGPGRTKNQNLWGWHGFILDISAWKSVPFSSSWQQFFT
jgi:hypothetical protein